MSKLKNDHYKLFKHKQYTYMQASLPFCSTQVKGNQITTRWSDQAIKLQHGGQTSYAVLGNNLDNK